MPRGWVKPSQPKPKVKRKQKPTGGRILGTPEIQAAPRRGYGPGKRTRSPEPPRARSSAPVILAPPHQRGRQHAQGRFKPPPLGAPAMGPDSSFESPGVDWLSRRILHPNPQEELRTLGFAGASELQQARERLQSHARTLRAQEMADAKAAAQEAAPHGLGGYLHLAKEMPGAVVGAIGTKGEKTLHQMQEDVRSLVWSHPAQEGFKPTGTNARALELAGRDIGTTTSVAMDDFLVGKALNNLLQGDFSQLLSHPGSVAVDAAMLFPFLKPLRVTRAGVEAAAALHAGMGPVAARAAFKNAMEGPSVAGAIWRGPDKFRVRLLHAGELPVALPAKQSRIGRGLVQLADKARRDIIGETETGAGRFGFKSEAQRALEEHRRGVMYRNRAQFEGKIERLDELGRRLNDDQEEAIRLAFENRDPQGAYEHHFKLMKVAQQMGDDEQAAWHAIHADMALGAKRYLGKDSWTGDVKLKMLPLGKKGSRKADPEELINLILDVTGGREQSYLEMGLLRDTSIADRIAAPRIIQAGGRYVEKEAQLQAALRASPRWEQVSRANLLMASRMSSNPEEQRLAYEASMAIFEAGVRRAAAEHLDDPREFQQILDTIGNVERHATEVPGGALAQGEKDVFDPRGGPGHYGNFLYNFRALPLDELRGIHKDLLASGRYGAAWPHANYRRALERVINEKASAAGEQTLYQLRDISPQGTKSGEWSDQFKAEMQAVFGPRATEAPFYSPLYRALDALPDKISTTNFAKTLKSAGKKAGGKEISDEEIKWSGIEEFLKTDTGQAKSVSKDELRAWLDKNYLELEENLRWISPDQAREMGLDMYGGQSEVGGDLTKWANDSLTLTGENNPSHGELTIGMPKERYDTLYAGGHWSESNVLFHVRFAVAWVDGKRTLFIEEIQSDWHQAAKRALDSSRPVGPDNPRRGYAKPIEQMEEYPAVMAAADEAHAQVDDLIAKIRASWPRDELGQGKLIDYHGGEPPASTSIDRALQVDLESDGRVDSLIRNLTQIKKARDYNRDHGGDFGVSMHSTWDDGGVAVFLEHPIIAQPRSGYGSILGGADATAPAATDMGIRTGEIELSSTAYDRDFFAAVRDEYSIAVSTEARLLAERSLAPQLDGWQLLMDMPEAEFNALVEDTTKLGQAHFSVRHAEDNLQRLRDAQARGIPEGPFKDTWEDVAIKRMLAWAVDHGFERIGWTSGETQNERNQFGNFFSRMRVEGGDDSSYEIGGDRYYAELEDHMANWEPDYYDAPPEPDPAEITDEHVYNIDLNNYEVDPEGEHYHDPWQYPGSQPSGVFETPEAAHDAYTDDMSAAEYEANDAIAAAERDHEQEMEDWRNQEEEYARENFDNEWYYNHDTSGGDTWNIYAWKKDTDPNGPHDGVENDVPDSELENYVGTEYAQRIRNGETDFQGEGLWLGPASKKAAGMSHFYDKEIRGFIKTYLKKFGIEAYPSTLGQKGVRREWQIWRDGVPTREQSRDEQQATNRMKELEASQADRAPQDKHVYKVVGAAQEFWHAGPNEISYFVKPRRTNALGDTEYLVMRRDSQGKETELNAFWDREEAQLQVRSYRETSPALITNRQKLGTEVWAVDLPNYKKRDWEEFSKYKAGMGDKIKRHDPNAIREYQSWSATKHPLQEFLEQGPLFQRGGALQGISPFGIKGYIHYAGPQNMMKAWVGYTEHADLTTFIHELIGHWLPAWWVPEHDYRSMVKFGREIADKLPPGDIEQGGRGPVVNGNLDPNRGPIDIPASEAVADAAIEYIRSGVGTAPVKNYVKTLSRFFNEIYDGTSVVDLTPQMHGVFSRMLGWKPLKGSELIGPEDLPGTAGFARIPTEYGRPLPKEISKRAAQRTQAVKDFIFSGGQTIGAGPRDKTLYNEFRGRAMMTGYFTAASIRPTVRDAIMAVRVSTFHRVREDMMKIAPGRHIPGDVSDIALKIKPDKTTNENVAKLLAKMKEIDRKGGKLSAKDLESINLTTLEESVRDLLPATLDDPLDPGNSLEIREYAADIMNREREPDENLLWIPRDILETSGYLPPKGIAKALASRSGPGQLGLTTVDEINNVLKLTVLYLNPSYYAVNLVGNLVMNLLHQGFATPLNLYRSALMHQWLDGWERRTIDKEMGNGLTTAMQLKTMNPNHLVHRTVGHWANLAVDLIPRRSAWIHEARRAGYVSKDSVRDLLRRASNGEKEALDDMEKIARTANDAIVDYERLSPFEREVVSRIIFFYPWLKGATRYTAQFALDHPVKSAALMLIAEQAYTAQQDALGPTPYYESSDVPLALRKNPIPVVNKLIPKVPTPSNEALGLRLGIPTGLLGLPKIFDGPELFNLAQVFGDDTWRDPQGNPMVFDVKQLFTFTTPMDLYRAAYAYTVGSFTGDYKNAPAIVDNLTPFLGDLLVSIQGYDPFRKKEVPRGLHTLVKQFEDIPQRQKLQLLNMSPSARRKYMENSINPRSREQAWWYIFGSGLAPTSYSPEVAARRLLSDKPTVTRRAQQLRDGLKKYPELAHLGPVDDKMIGELHESIDLESDAGKGGMKPHERLAVAKDYLKKHMDIPDADQMLRAEPGNEFQAQAMYDRIKAHLQYNTWREFTLLWNAIQGRENFAKGREKVPSG